MQMPQYTIRRVPESVDAELRRRAHRRGVSLNEATLEAIRRGLGMAGDEIVYHDLDDLAGTWVPDDDFDRAIDEQRAIDGEAWR
jgi:plasmid stability protein